MEKRELLTYVAAVLTTLLEVDGAPASTIYLAIGSDIDRWHYLEGILVQAGWIDVSPAHWVTLTEEGRKKAEICAMVMAS